MGYVTIFNKIQYPRCPVCLTEINDLSIISMQDLSSPFFHLKKCPVKKCGEPFLMKTRVELTTETVPIEDL